MNEGATALALAAATLVSEDGAAIAAAVLAGEGHLRTSLAVVAVSAGIYCGDLLLFLSGRAGVRLAPIRRYVDRRWSSDELDRLASSLDRRLAFAVLGSRLLPGTRLPMYIAAGMFSRRAVAFCLWTLLAVVLWTPALMLGVVVLGETFAASALWYWRWAPALVALVAVNLGVRALRTRRRS